MVTEPEALIIFDTTLRDGEQSPGCSMGRGEKLRVARALAELGVDVIEAGFPAASRGDWESVNAVAREVQGSIICALARCNREDIELAAKALRDAPRHRLHVFLATSAIHRQYKLNMAQDEILHLAVDAVRMARELCADVEFSPEDASRTELEFLAQVVEAVIDAGATTVNIPDTVGYTVPDEFAELFRYLRKNVRGIERATLSVHCHDDLGMAVANSLTAVVAGARQVECTINGIGERAGNCSLEEVVMALKTRATFFNVRNRVQTTKLYPTSRLVSSITGLPIPRNKAIVGENAFAHESGIH
jgi:2-isopropylmalate synthase